MSSRSQRMRVYRFEEPIEDSLAPRRAPQRRRRRRFPFIPVLIALAVLAVLAGGLAWLGRDTGAQIPGGTRIDGVDVGGMTAAEAKIVVRQHGKAVVDRGLTLVAGDNRFEIDPDAIKLRANAQIAVRSAVADSSFLERVQGTLGFGDTRNIPLTYLYNPRELAQAILPVRQAVTVLPRNANVVKRTLSGTFVVVPAKNGQRPDIGALHTSLRNYGDDGPELDVPLNVTKPAILTDEAETAAAQARLFVKSPHRVSLRGAPRRVPRDVAVRASQFVTGDGGIRFDLSRSVLRAFFSRTYGSLEKAPRNAIFTVNAAGKARILGSKDGRGVDVDSLVATWLAEPTQADTPITIGIRRPALTSEKAQQMGVKQIVGAFTTPYSGGARVSNIRRGAEILDQYIIPAQGTFSLNKALGERTEARGFVAAPMIGEGGVLKDAIGGGVSQIATTTYNAAFFAGLKLIEHTPHSFWITRYPKGREATVSWGGPELIFQNNWDAPIVILTHTDAEGITVTFLSDPLGRKVTEWTGSPYSFTPAKIIRIKDPTLPPGEAKFDQMKGSDGFHINYGRSVFKNGKLISKQKWHWRYAPENAIVRIGPKPGGGGGGAAPTDTTATDPTTDTTATIPTTTG